MLSGPSFRLSGLWPPMLGAVQYLQQWADYLGYSAVIVSGFRTSEEQRINYAKGRTAYEIQHQIRKHFRDGSVTDAPPGQSAHNYGLAIDVEGPDQAKVLFLAQQIGFQLVTGDPAHIQWPNWRQLLG